MRPDPSGQYVYFIKPVGQTGPIKIGFSHIPFERLNVQMNWSPVRLEIVAWAEGGRGEERALHERFSAFRSHCEWFWPSPDLIEGIAAVSSGASLERAFGLTHGRVQPADWYVPRKPAPSEQGAAA